jgi:hypothetical protein
MQHGSKENKRETTGKQAGTRGMGTLYAKWESRGRDRRHIGEASAVTRACKFLLFPRADVAPSDRARGAVIVNRCRSLLIARSGRFNDPHTAQPGRSPHPGAFGADPPPPGEGKPARPLLKFWAVAFVADQPARAAAEISRRCSHISRPVDWHGPCEACSVARLAAFSGGRRPRPWGPPIQRTGE